MTKTPNYVFDTDDVLCHHGIPNQRWGHRRFQNEDGSLTPEGRERYGVDKARSKADAQKAKARISYNTQKYKADLKSKAQRDKDKRAAKEERNRIREAEKTARIQKKEQAKTDTKGQAKFKLGKTKNMSDEDLQKAVDRLKLQAEYNKSYVLATQPNSALAKADRFFEGPTGKAALEISKAVLPQIASSATTAILTSKLKYANKEDRDYKLAETEKKRADAEKVRAEVSEKNVDIEKKKYELENTKEKDKIEAERSTWRFDKEKDDASYERAKDSYKFKSEMLDAAAKRKMEISKHNHEVDNADRKAKTEDDIARTNQAIAVKNARQEAEWKKKEMEGFDTKDGGITRHHTGKLERDADQRALDTHYENEHRQAELNKTHALNNQEVIAKQIANQQASANVRNTEAQTESIRTQSANARASNKATNDQIRANTRYTNAQAESIRAETANKRASNKPTYRIVPSDSKTANDQPRRSPFVKKQQESMYKAAAKNLKNQGYTLEEIANRFNVSIYTIEKLLYK